MEPSVLLGLTVLVSVWACRIEYLAPEEPDSHAGCAF